MPIQIDAKKILLVEGVDEVNFFEALLKKLNINMIDDSIQVLPVGGKNNFPSNLDALVKGSEFSMVESLGIIRDADKSVDYTFQSIDDLLRKYNLNRPTLPNTFSERGTPKVGVFIMPGNSSEGMLEDLCLNSVENKPLMQCVEAFMQCAASKTATDEYPRIKAKAKAHAYLSVMHETVTSVGLGAKKGYWDFDHECMANLKDFIEQFIR